MAIRSALRPAAWSVLGLVAAGPGAEAAAQRITLEPLGSYREAAPDPAEPGVCRRNISEIGAYDPLLRRLFVVNYADNAVDIFDVRDPEHDLHAPRRISIAGLTGDSNLTPTSVAVRFPLVAIAAELIEPVTDPGKLLILGVDGRLLRSFDVGSGPDMVTFTPDGQHVLVAVEGEPDKTPAGPGKVDPEGSVAILDLRHGIFDAELRRAEFSGLDARELVARGVRIGADLTDPEPDPLKKRLNSPAKDLEPEFIATSRDSHRAYATLQENNAVAVVDVDAARIEDILPLGLKDHNVEGAGLDPSRKDGPDETELVNIVTERLAGAYQPDGIATFEREHRTYFVTANEGDARNGDFDIAPLADLVGGKDANENPFAPLPLEPSFPADLTGSNRLGELEVSDLPQDLDPQGVRDGKIHQLVSLGGRSFSIWTKSGHSAQRIYDSGDQFERITALATPTLFNTQDDDNSFDRRSPKRGPEPEGVAVGQAFDRTYAFIGLERHSGIMVYDVTEPHAPSFQGYFNTRVFAQDPNQVAGQPELPNTLINCAAGDLGPEGVLFIPALLSPNFRPLLVVNYETSGSTRIFEIAPAGR